MDFFCNTLKLQNPRIHDELGVEHTVLHIAARYGHLPIVKSILEVLDNGNKNPASSYDGVTPLHCAATSLKGKLEVLELFFRHGVDINVKDKYGMTGRALVDMDWCVRLGCTHPHSYTRTWRHQRTAPSPCNQRRTRIGRMAQY